ncbi:PspC domain-containing protein [Corynebacterium sp. CCM 9204]|uniref:PspC domain-containing protein n=1 Tax=Corynebacterium sp. CCM 9204 TaxID=3057616 RepID=UPI0035232F49
MDSTPPPTAPDSRDLSDTLRQMWATRPPRIPSDQGGNAKIAGVCEGIGTRFNVDPTLIRIAFVVAALCGGGVLLYLLAWLIMPRWSVPVSPVEAIVRASSDPRLKSERSLGYTLIIVMLLIAWPASSSDLLSSSTLLTTLIGFAIWWLLHSRQPVPPEGLLVTSPETSDTEAGPATGNPSPDSGDSRIKVSPNPGLVHLKPAKGYDIPDAQPVPPDWDPLGTVPELWNLPEPGPVPTPPPTRSRWLTAGGIIALMIGAAGGIGLISLSVGTAFFALAIPTLAWTSCLGALIGGTGIGVGLLSRGGLRKSALILGIGALVALTITVGNTPRINFKVGGDTGSTRIAPTSGATLPADVDNGVGKTELDLRGLQPLAESRKVEVSNGVGKTIVWLPTDVPVTVTCSNGVGKLVCTPGDYNPGAEGERLTLDISNGIGTVVVHTK